MACLLKCVRICEHFQNARVLIARATRVSLTESVLVTLEREFLIDGHAARSGSSATRANRHNYVFPNGSEIICGGLDNPDRIMSTEYDFVYVAEATEISEEAWEKLLTRLRNNRVPYQQGIADCNPAAPGHWLNKRAKRGQMERLISLHADNPSCTPQYLERLSKLTGHRRARLFEGRWVAAEGSVFGAEFNESRNLVKPFEVPSNWPVWFWLDPGYDHPCGAFWMTISPTGKRFVVSELYERQTAIADDPDTDKPGLATMIRRKEQALGLKPLKRFLDPRYGFSRSSMNNGTTICEQYLAEGLEFDPWPRLQGESQDAAVNAVRKLLTSGQLLLFNTCANFQMELQSWSYKRNAAGEQLSGDDQYVDSGNHLIDPLLGSVTQALQFTDNIPPEAGEPFYNPDDDEPVIED